MHPPNHAPCTPLRCNAGVGTRQIGNTFLSINVRSPHANSISSRLRCTSQQYDGRRQRGHLPVVSCLALTLFDFGIDLVYAGRGVGGRQSLTAPALQTLLKSTRCDSNTSLTSVLVVRGADCASVRHCHHDDATKGPPFQGRYSWNQPVYRWCQRFLSVAWLVVIRPSGRLVQCPNASHNNGIQEEIHLLTHVYTSNFLFLSFLYQLPRHQLLNF